MSDMEHNHAESYFFLGLLAAALVLTFLVFLPYLDAIVLSATFAIVFTPLYERLVRFGVRQGLAAFLTVALVFLLLIIPLTVFSIRLFDQAINLYARLSSPDADGAIGAITDAVRKITVRFNLPVASFELNEYFRRAAAWAVQHLGSVFSGFLSAVGFFFLSLLGLYYFIRDGKKFSRALAGLTPLSPEYTDAIFSKLLVTVNSVVRGTLAVAVAQGLFAGVGFAIFGVPSAIFWGSIAIITSLIPMIGTAVIIVPAIAYLLLTGHPAAGIGLALWGLLVVGLVDNVLRPLLLERSVNIHPFLILLSVLGGFGLFGPIGFLMGPLVLSLLFALLEIYATAVLKKENVPETA